MHHGTSKSTSKILLQFILLSIERKLENELVQAFSRQGRDHIFNMRTIFRKLKKYNEVFHTCLIDYSKATTHHERHGIFIHIIYTLYHKCLALLGVAFQTRNWFEVEIGVSDRSGCCIKVTSILHCRLDGLRFKSQQGDTKKKNLIDQ